MNLTGKVSWFGGPGDPTDSGHTANGETTKTPGIAVYNHGTLGGYWRVSAPNGKTVVLKQTDIGPAPWTGRKIDVTYSALGQFGYGEHDFPTDSEFKATYLGKNAPKGALRATGSPPVRLPGLSAAQTPTFDQGGFQKAQKAAVLGKLIASEGGAKDNPLLATGLVSTRLPQRSEYEGLTTEPHVLKGEGHSTYVPQGSNVTKLSGTVDFGGKKVAAWIAPALHYAQQHGWKGSVESGYRSFAEQEHIYDSGVRPAAVPGTSNHEGDKFPRGAVDVTDAEALSRILRSSPYANLLVWAGGKDPVHFSHPHNGSY